MTTKKRKISEIQQDLDQETEINPAKLAKILDEVETQEIDGQNFKRLVLSLEKRINFNQAQRVKYKDEPEKFLESEVDLDESIKALHAITTQPEMFKPFVDSGTIISLLSLLNHENPDIAIDVIDFFYELTDPETAADNYEESKIIIEALLENETLEIVISTLTRFKSEDPEDKNAVYNSLGIVENMLEMKPEVNDLLREKTQFFKYMIDKIKPDIPFDTNKLYFSEVLSILLQENEKTQMAVGEIGLETLLISVSKYRKQNPATAEEEEYLENLFNCICSCLLLESNKNIFFKCEGIQLMLIVIKFKKIGRKSALKVLDFALNGNIGGCKRFIDLYGLKTLFPAFMRKGADRHKKGFSEQEDDEHIISCLASLLRSIDVNSSRFDRILAKFLENDFEKIDRLMELHEKYFEKVDLCKQDIEKAKADILKGGETLDEEDEESFYLETLEAGLFTLQFIDYIIAEICLSDKEGFFLERVQKLFSQRKRTLSEIESTLENYIKNIGDKKSDDEIKQENINQEIENLKNLLEEFKKHV